MPGRGAVPSAAWGSLQTPPRKRARVGLYALAEAEDDLRSVRVDIVRQQALASERLLAVQEARDMPPLGTADEIATVSLTAAQQEQLHAAFKEMEEAVERENEGMTEIETQEAKAAVDRRRDEIRAKLELEWAKDRAELFATHADIVDGVRAEFEEQRTADRAEEAEQVAQLRAETAAVRKDIEEITRSLEEDVLEKHAAQLAEERAQLEEQVGELRTRSREAGERRREELLELGKQRRELHARIPVPGRKTGEELRAEVAQLRSKLSEKEAELGGARGQGVAPRIDPPQGGGRGGIPAPVSGRGGGQASTPSLVVPSTPTHAAPAAGAAPSGEFRVGDKVEALYGVEWHPCTIRKIYSGMCDVDWDAEDTFTAGLSMRTSIRRRAK